VIALPFLNLDYSNWIEEYNELISRVTVESLNLVICAWMTALKSRENVYLNTQI
jgi:hypothetical protein